MRAPVVPRAAVEDTLGRILGRALRDPSYALIFLGFFSCGYQLGFITAHFPAFVTELCGPIAPGGILHALGITTTSALGAISISLIGLANVGGHAARRLAGQDLVQEVPARRDLRRAHSGRGGVHPDADHAGHRAAVLGGDGGAVACHGAADRGADRQIFGVRYLGTLYGIVFFSHQLGSFMGVWLGGRMYDLTGGYTAVWWIGLGVGALSAIVHLPIRETRSPVMHPA